MNLGRIALAFAAWLIFCVTATAQTSVLQDDGIFHSAPAFQATTGGQVNAVFANVPAVGAANDTYALNFNFATANGTQYQGVVIQAVQASATNGAPSTRFIFSVDNAGVLAEAMRIQSSGGLSIGTATDPGAGGLQVNGSSVFGAGCGNNAVGCLSLTQNLTPIDSASWGLSFARIGTNLSTAGSGVAGSANQFGVDVQCTIGSTSSAASYEKSCGLVIAQTADVATGLILRDAVGWDTRCYVTNGNTLGRCWGGVDLVQINSGGTGEGLLTGREIDVYNNGADQGSVNTTTSKYGLTVFAYGSNNSTAALLLGSGTGSQLWHYGLYMDPSALVASTGVFLNLQGKFSVDVSGNLSAATVTVSSAITTQEIIGGTTSSSTLTLASTSGTGTTDYINFLVGSHAEAMRINSGATIGIGTTATPAGILEIVSQNGGVSPLVQTVYSADANGVSIIGRKARGTLALAGQTLASDALMSIVSRGYNNNTAFTGNNGAIKIVALNDQTTTDTSTFITFEATPSGSTSRAIALKIQASGGVSIGSGNTSTDPGLGGLVATTVLANGASGGIGYTTGSGGTVTQATSKATGVTLSKMSGQITMNNAALAGSTIVSFVLTNTSIAATDTIIVSHISAGTVGSYTATATPASGSATIFVRNNTGGSLSEAIVLQFTVIKSTTS